MNESWRPVVGYEGRYEVSDLGRIRSLPKGNRRTSIILKPISGTDPYLFVELIDSEGRHRTLRIHRLVLEAFIGPRPEGLVTRHLNGDGEDNRLVNLSYGTNSENMHDRVRHGRHREAGRTHCPRGHPYDDQNTRRIASRPNSRYCIACSERRADCDICGANLRLDSLRVHARRQHGIAA